jgi:hypothetical protein
VRTLRWRREHGPTRQECRGSLFPGAWPAISPLENREVAVGSPQFTKPMIRHLICLLLAVASPLMAGSADAVVRGKTESGRTEVEVRVGDMDGLIRSVKLTIDGESYSSTAGDDAPQSVIRDPKNGVYVLVLEADGRKFRLWMIPRSEKIIEQGAGVYRSRFAAVIEATDPRKAKSAELTPRITLGCTLDWEI